MSSLGLSLGIKVFGLSIGLLIPEGVLSRPALQGKAGRLARPCYGTGTGVFDPLTVYGEKNRFLARDS